MPLSIYRTNRDAQSLAKYRTILAGLLHALEPFHERYVGRLSDGDRSQIRDANSDAFDRCNAIGMPPPLVQWMQRPSASSGKPIIDVTGLRAEIANVEALVAVADTLDTLPEVDEYARAYEAFRDAYGRLADAVKAVGLDANRISYFLQVPHFSA